MCKGCIFFWVKARDLPLLLSSHTSHFLVKSLNMQLMSYSSSAPCCSSCPQFLQFLAFYVVHLGAALFWSWHIIVSHIVVMQLHKDKFYIPEKSLSHKNTSAKSVSILLHNWMDIHSLFIQICPGWFGCPLWVIKVFFFLSSCLVCQVKQHTHGPCQKHICTLVIIP